MFALQGRRNALTLLEPKKAPGFGDMMLSPNYVSSMYTIGKHVLPVIVLIMYSLLGGAMFQYIEQYVPSSMSVHNLSMSNHTAYSWSKKAPSHDHVWKAMFDSFASDLAGTLENVPSALNISATNLTRRRKSSPLYKDVSALLEDYKHRSVIINEQHELFDNGWNFWNATLYAATLYTTIGYGNLPCRTTVGRVATIFYSIVGIPLVLTVLNDWGSLLFKMLRCIHEKWKKDKHDESDISVISAFVLLLFWICTSAGVFLIWEDNWDYFTSFYFFFITLTTIGLGDVTPDKPEYALWAFFFVLIGLSVVSMCISIIQAKIEHVFQSLLANIDLEYRKILLDPAETHMDDDSLGSGLGVMKLYRQKPFKERLLYNLMDNYKKQMLMQHWKKRACNRNKHTQTDRKKFCSQMVQVDIEDDDKKKVDPFRKYIYNLDD